MNVLITLTDPGDPGGITNYFATLRNKFTVSTRYFITGRRQGEKGNISRILRSSTDYWNFMRCIRINNIDLVHLNPYFDLKAFIREGIFVLLAKAAGKKVAVFFHGEDNSFRNSISRRWLSLFKFFYGKVDCFIVLSNEMKETLKEWGVKVPIYHEVTVIDDDFLNGFGIHDALKKRESHKKWRVLFLSRILRDKGIYETIEAVSLLKAKYPMIELVVAGDGNELENAKAFAQNLNMLNVTFTGYIKGEAKRQAFETAHIFCFPTNFGEGMPTAVIEAMAFGLPVVTRPVRGLGDCLKNGEHGYITTSMQPQVFANMIEKLFCDKNLYNKISSTNYRYAQIHFLASNSALRLDRIYEAALGYDKNEKQAHVKAVKC